MATIRKLPSGNWNVQIRANGKLHASKTFSTRSRAESWIKRNDATIEELHPLFLDAGHTYCYLVLNRKPSQKLSSNLIDRVCQFGPMQNRMNKISLQDIHAFKQYRLSEVSESTCRDELLMIRRVFKWYIRESVAEGKDRIENPSDLITMPPASKPRERVVSRTELQLLLNAMSAEMAIVVELAYETAMRRSELLKITPRDVNIEQRFLCVIDGKEGNRDVPLTRRAVTLLQQACQGRSPADRNPVFSMAAYSLSQAVRRARQRAGLDSDVRFHQLRHSRISEVARKGFNQAQIMMVSGHRDVRSVQRYTHLNVQDVIDLID